MKALRSLLVDKPISGHLRVKYHNNIREILIFNDGLSTIKCLNCNNVLFNVIVTDCMEIDKLKKQGKSSKLAELKLNQKYGLIYDNILFLGSSIKLTDIKIKEKVLKLTKGSAEVFDNGLNLIPFLKLPFHIIIRRHLNNEIISEEE